MDIQEIDDKPLFNDDQIKELLKKQNNSSTAKMVVIDIRGIHKGYFGVELNGSFYYPDYKKLRAASWRGQGFVDIIWPEASIEYSIPSGHLGLDHFHGRTNSHKPTPQFAGCFWLMGGRIQDVISALHVVELERKPQAKEDYATFRVDTFWFEENGQFRVKNYLNERISNDHMTRYDRRFVVPPE